MDLVVCPECSEPATVAWTDAVDGSPGPVVMARVDCLGRHWYVLPAERLRSWPAGHRVRQRSRF